MPKLRPEAFYSESYSFLYSAEDGTFARVQFLVSNAGLEARGRAAARAVIVLPDGTTVEDADTFDPEQWSIHSEGAIEMGAHRLTMGPDASHHVHFAGKKLVLDATVLPETKALRPGGGRVVFDASGRAVFDQTIFALRSRFDGTVWSARRGNKRVKGYCYADTSYSTVPAYKSASLWLRMEAFDDGADGTAALAVLFPPQGSLRQPEGWLYTSRNGNTEIRASDKDGFFCRCDDQAAKRSVFLHGIQVLIQLFESSGVENVRARVRAIEREHANVIVADLALNHWKITYCRHSFHFGTFPANSKCRRPEFTSKRAAFVTI